MKKKQLVADGKLGKYGKILDSTPSEVREEFSLSGKSGKTGEVATVKATPGVETLSAAGTTTPTLTSTARKKVFIMLFESFLHNYQ